jgi:antitoxin (DNA-binding transcriptional repressor) of toxin-antitoxin stability system
MQTMSVQEAQSRLSEIIHKLSPGEEITITLDDKPVATLRGNTQPRRKPRRPGTLRGTVLYIAPDFDDIPEGFEEYVE